MPDYNGSITLFVHDSDCCTYLGMSFVDYGPYVGEYDLYTCLQGGRRPPTILARYGNDGPNYYSGLCFAAEDRNPVLWEGAKRAIALGLLTQEELDKEINYKVTGSIRFESAGFVEKGKITSYTSFEEEEDSVPYFSGTDFCPDCDLAMIWDAGERIYYCPNTWEHG